MKRPNITPGPWHPFINFQDEEMVRFDRIKCPTLENVAFIPDHERPMVEEQANARAIAAVPALLKLAERMLERLDCAIQKGNCMAYASAVDGNAGACIEDFQMAKKTLIAAGYQF